MSAAVTAPRRRQLGSGGWWTRYDAELCRCQDHRGALLAAIEGVVRLQAGVTRAVDVGGGTGKIAKCLLGARVGAVAIVDRSADALAVARESCEPCTADGASDVSYHEADQRSLPLADGAYDLVVAGWALSYLKSEHEEWHRDGSSGGPWRAEVDAALAEWERVLAPGGTLIVFETRGTPTATPQRAGSDLSPSASPFTHTSTHTQARRPPRRSERAASSTSTCAARDCTRPLYRLPPFPPPSRSTSLHLAPPS